MPRITITDKAAEELEAIKTKNWRLTGNRGLDDVVAYLIEDYNQRKNVQEMLQDHQKAIEELLGNCVELGVKKALKEWVTNILSLKGL